MGMTLTIKFSHRYVKLPQGYESSELLAVFSVNLEDLGSDFICYDTMYYGNGGVEFYPLPKKGEYMVLLLLSADDVLWTTIRRATPTKEAYYKKNIGQIFKCILTEEP